MSYDKTMEEFLDSVRELPTALSYNEVEFLFLNPTPPSTAHWPWWRGGYLKFLLMFTLLISLLGFLLPTQADVAGYQLSAFPVQEVTPTYTVNSLPKTSGFLALKTPDIIYITPQVEHLAPNSSIAPAAAPEKTDAVENVISPAAIITPKQSTTQYNQTPRITRELYTGKYLYYRNNYSLTFQEVKGGPVNLLFIELSPAEQRLMRNNEAGPMVIERATGDLLLYGGKKDGHFVFLSNTAYREFLNKRGWGDAAAPENSLEEVTVGKLTKKELKSGGRRKAKRPHDQLWFRYFTTDINRAYTDLLQHFGYAEEELSQLWQLTNYQLEYEELKEVLELSSAVFADRPPLAQLSQLEHQRDALKTLRREGQRMTFEKYRNLHNYRKMFINLPGKSAEPIDRDSLRQLVEQEKELNFSLARPGSSSDTIAYTPGAKIILTGNFKYRINKDLAGQQVIVYGPERAVAKMNRRSDYGNLRLINKNKRQPLYIDVPLHINMQINPSKGVTTSIKSNPK